MKHAIIILTAVVFAFFSCSKEADLFIQEEPQVQQNEVVFELSVRHPGEISTKVVKTGWEAGDVIFVFFNNVPAPKYLRMTYDGWSWTCTQMNGTTEESLGLTENATGTMRAVYLPFGNNATISASGTSFSFSENIYSYYLTATLDYTVKNGKVSGAFHMQIPEGYVQFFLKDANATSSAEIEIREPHLTPQGVAGVRADGSITYLTSAHGAPLKGYVYDKNGTGTEKGYLFSGILAAGARNVSTKYHLTLVSGGWQGSYYFKSFTSQLYWSASEFRAVILPALSKWTLITDYKPIDLGCNVAVGVVTKRIYWCSRNVGASSDGPADDNRSTYGDYFAWGETEPNYEEGDAFKYSPHWKTGKEYGYDWKNYKWSNGSVTKLTKYCNVSDHGNEGFTDSLTTLEASDDAATANLGGVWRTPTSEEWNALLQSIAFAWTWDNTNKGYAVYYKGGNAWETPTIFIPASGMRDTKYYYQLGSNGHYWSSTLNTEKAAYDKYYPNRAWHLLFDSTSKSVTNEYDRNKGFMVRPVTD